jgi:sorbitol-specific phosphotransferase system component IIBC
MAESGIDTITIGEVWRFLFPLFGVGWVTAIVVAVIGYRARRGNFPAPVAMSTLYTERAEIQGAALAISRLAQSFETMADVVRDHVRATEEQTRAIEDWSRVLRERPRR